LIAYSAQSIDEEDIECVKRVLDSAFLTQGDEVRFFEEEIARFVGARYALCFNSATSALYAAYKSILPPKTRVITTPISFVATSNMLLECVLEPIFVDVLANGNISPASIKELLDSLNNSELANISGIVSVDYGGNSVLVNEIGEIAKKYNLCFISDSSHSFGAKINGKHIGGLCEASIFSFHAIKPITTAEGGALVTNNKDIYQQAKLIRSHGLIKKDLWDSEVESIGFNFRMNEIQAALGRSQLKKINKFLAKRERIARFYDKKFANNPYFTALHSLNNASLNEHNLSICAKDIPNMNYISTNHLYPILLNQKLFSKKDKIFNALIDNKIGVQVHYKPIYKYAIYSRFARNLANAEEFYLAELSIPCHQSMSDEEVRYCANNVLEIVGNS